MRIKADKADLLFSKLIRERDKRCVFCGRSEGKLENSHYWSRGNKRTRFDPRNCDLLCFLCHTTNESNKQGMYREFKLKQLGKEEYFELQALAQQRGKYGQRERDAMHKHLKTFGLRMLLKEMDNLIPQL